ncbi:biotin transport system substrate-specific component [Alteribacillus persepolensis]|uniref:Biotin transporter n=1 Tax=Alteribacillus persepolensis TaxID=568899 RepID=A0A1G8DZS7_9BACI|nr:biotin transporter BioY [Alteribacillus persepolensis]SDH63127.1 biotin transport system substrate-specific component [Alteribacillus persepolensis]
MKLKPLDMVLVALFAALMGIGANITAYLVIGGVPITLQPIIAMLAGSLLGSRLGALAMVVYMLTGLVGIPVFAEFSGGLRALVSPTFGFILSFILTAYLTGKIIEHKQNPTLPTFFIASFIGLAVNYLIGTHYMYYAYLWIAEAPEGFTYSMVWAWMIFPLIKDIIFTALAAAAAPKLYRLICRNSTYTQQRTA